jgi:hypothetical protein
MMEACARRLGIRTELLRGAQRGVDDPYGTFDLEIAQFPAEMYALRLHNSEFSAVEKIIIDR